MKFDVIGNKAQSQQSLVGYWHVNFQDEKGLTKAVATKHKEHSRACRTKMETGFVKKGTLQQSDML